jgi:tetratricopeptide (TPR) repeat protein
VVDSARLAYEQAIALDSTYGSAYLALAQLLDDEGEFEQALGYARRALDLEPTSTEAQYLVGTELLKAGHPAEAIPVLEVVALTWPWHAGAHLNLGQALLRVGREAEGRLVTEKAQRLRELEARVGYAEQTVRNVPQDPYAHAALASALRMSGRYNDAMHAYQVALSLDPANLEIQNNVAALHLLRDDTTAAIRTYQHILAQDPKLVDVWLNLGVLYVLSGDQPRARQAWERALQQQPDNASARAFLAKLEEEQGRGGSR